MGANIEEARSAERSGLSSPASLIIAGKVFETKEAFPVIDPATGAPFAVCPQASRDDMQRAIDAARKAFPSWAATPIDERAAAIEKIAAAVEGRKQELAELLSREQGKTIHIGALGEISAALGWARATAKMRPEVEVIRDDESGRIEVHRKPLGVVASITPWNHPVMIAIWHVMPALLTGNTVVLKPSSNTPLSTLKLVEIANEFLPAGVLNSIAGGGLGSALADHAGIDKIVFTGSTPTGRDIMKRGAANLKRLTLELGGNDAAIVLPDADIEEFAKKIFAKTFGNSGQTCAAIKRLYVHDSVHDALAGRLAEMAKAAVVGPGNDPKTQYGPVQNKSQYDYLCALAKDARDKGGKFLAGGVPEKADGGFFFPLTVVVDVKDGMAVVDEEQFGPILPIIRFHDIEEALRLANGNENGLGGSIWSGDLAKAKALATRLECGSAWVNDHSSISPDAPFGGAKQSGIGTEFGLHGLDEYLQLQTLRTPAV
jgi:acyl-CoA reductase-like NAD-dependent aldehyde dehydrogenase